MIGKKLDVANETSELYRRLRDLGWEAQPATPKREAGNLLYQVKMTGPAGQNVVRTGVSEVWALANALSYAQRQNTLRGAALENTLPTHQPIPGVRYNRAVRATERDPNHDWQSPYKSDFNDEMRGLAPGDQKIPEELLGHVQSTAQDIDTGWYLSQDPHKWEQAVMNAFRVALLSPRKDFKWNAVHYQDVMDLPPDANSGDLFRRLETRRQAWNNVYRGDPLVHVRYKKQLKKLEDQVAHSDPTLAPDDVRGIALGVIGKLMSNAEKFYVAYVMRSNPKRFNGKWIDPPTQTEIASKAQDAIMGQLDLSQGSPDSEKASFATALGLKPLALEDYIQESRGRYEPGSFTGPKEEDLARAREGQKSIRENYGAFIYDHLDSIEAVGKHINEVAQYAHDDITKYGGSGHYFRNNLLNLGILGVNPKVASFAWLLLAPRTSQLGTMDTHMARFLTGSPETGTHMPGNNEESAGTPHHYYNMERQLAAIRDRAGYSHIPLGQFQWVTWDMARQKDAEGGATEPGSDHRSVANLNPKFYGDIDWPMTQRKQFGSGQVNYYHPPEWLRDAFQGRQDVAKDYVDTYGGYAQSDRPEPDKPKPPKVENLGKAYGRWGIPAPTLMPEPVLAFYSVGDYNDVLFPLYHGEIDYQKPEEEDWIPYEAEDDAYHHARVRPSQGYEWGYHQAALTVGLFTQAMHNVTLGDPDFFDFEKEAQRGYIDGVRAAEDRENQRAASSRTWEPLEALVYPSVYDIERIARSFEYPVDLDVLDVVLEDEVVGLQESGETDPFVVAANLIRAIQKATAHTATAMVAGTLYLEENGYPHAAQVLDDVKMADLVSGLRTASVKNSDLATFLEDQVADSAEPKPDFRFVFYKGVLDIRDWDHNLRFRNMIRDILNEYGKNIEDQDVMDQEIASGDVFRSNGGIDIKLESLADNDIQEQACRAVHNWAKDVNLVGPIQVL